MRPKFLLTIVILLVFLACYIAKEQLSRQGSADPASVAGDSGSLRDADGSDGEGSLDGFPRRIVSMAPSVTEIIFALGLGDRVVGVSRFCKYPPETAKIARIGGVLDPNIEAIVKLKPDLLIILHGHKSLCPTLDRFGLNTLIVDHKTVGGVLKSIPTIGLACGNSPGARRMAAELQARIDRVRRKTAGLKRPRVLLSVDRRQGAGRLEDVYVAGSDDYFDKFIEDAGGSNVFGDQPVRYAVVSAESIIKANPEIIIDIVRNVSGGGTIASGTPDKETPEQAARAKMVATADWQQLTEIDAVATGKVFCLDDDFISVPGPRFILLLEKLAKLLHPEVDWSQKDDGGKK